ncbi:MAG: hypothetical protein QOD77_721 [Thermoplasmata archaeon]|nr:hypothetical protein [Thermoplasmata archaeon]
MKAAALVATLFVAAVLLAGCGDSAGDTALREKLKKPSLQMPGGTDMVKVLGTQDGALRLLGDPDTSGLDDWTPEFDSVPTLVDFDGDGRSEVVTYGGDGQVHVFRQDGKVLARLPTTVPDGWYVDRYLNGADAAVMHPGEAPSIVVASPAGYVALWKLQGKGGDSLTFAKAWERRMDDCIDGASMDASATLADLDGDGGREILVQAEERGLFALNADGTLRWGWCWGGGNAAPIAEDLDGDGRREAIFASDGGVVSVFDGAKGFPLWTFDATQYGFTPASISVSPTVAELDGVAPKEVLFTVRQAESGRPDTFASQHMGIFAVHGRQGADHGAEALWVRNPQWANPLSYTMLRAGDLDGDGMTEIYGMDWNTIGHNPGNWENVGKPHVFRLDASGLEAWVTELETWWSNKDIAIADLDGDGVQDILATGPYEGADGIWALRSSDGRPTAFVPTLGWELLRGPSVADLDRDGKVDLVVPVKPANTSGEAGGVAVIQIEATYTTGAWR